MASILTTSRIAIVGLGQLGTSLAMAIKAVGCRELLAVSRRPESLQRAVNDDIIDAGSTEAGDVLPVVDVVFLCLPLTPSIDFVRDNLEHFRFGGLVTDVGSVKGRIVRELRPLLLEHGSFFIGSHPMAGSEKSGMDAARADLYQDAIVFMTPTEDDDEDAINLLRTFWSELGSVPLELSADRHDLAVANSSHLAHIVSAALVRAVLGEGDSDANQTACAGGFRDVSRIASSNVGMWTDICRQNTPAILQTLDGFEAQLAQARKALEDEDWDAIADFFGSGKELRDSWFNHYGKLRGYTQ